MKYFRFGEPPGGVEYLQLPPLQGDLSEVK